MRSVIFFTLLCFGFVFNGHSADFVRGKNVIITQPVEGDLYLVGSELRVNAPIHGDLVVAGRQIYLNDSILNDLTAAGGELFISGDVGDDIRIAGGSVEINGTVSGDLIIAGGKVRIGESALINGDLVISGGFVEVHGGVKGNLIGSGGLMRLFGRIGQDLDIKGGNVVLEGIVQGNASIVAEKISFGLGAGIDGDIEYWRDDGELDVDPSIVGGKMFFNPDLEPVSSKFDWWTYLGVGSVLFFFLYILSGLLIMALIQIIFPASVSKAADWIEENLVQSFGIGMLYIIGIPILVFLLVITVIGIPLGFFTFFMYTSTLFFASFIAAVLMANIINNRYDKQWGIGALVLAGLVILIFLKLVYLVPILGLLLWCFVTATGLGSLLLVFFKGKRAQAQV